MARLLLIDDDPFFCELLADWLADAAHQVTVAGDGRAGRQRLSESAFDLVITDVFMPDMDGFEFLRALREIDRPPPVIAMSGGHPVLGRGVFKLSAALGARRVLAKPFSRQDLLDAVDALLPPAAGTDQAPPEANN